MIDPARRLQELPLMVIVVREFDDVALAQAHESGRQHQEVGADGVQRGGQILRWQAQPLEPVHEVGREEHQLEKGDIRSPGVGGDLAQRIVVDEFPDVLLDGGAGAVEAVDPPNDKQQIAPMLETLAQLPEALGAVRELLADNGYFSAANVEHCEQAKIESLIAAGREAHSLPWQERFAQPTPEIASDDPVERMRQRLKTREGRVRATRLASRCPNRSSASSSR